VRIVFERYHFSEWGTGAWWTTTPVAETRTIPCSSF
jgi:hypothetical protein